MKKLFLVRHAHRDTSRGRQLDNGLSKKGVAQADALCRYLQALDLGGYTLQSSPAQRCLETLEPFALKTGAKIDIDDELYEQRPSESDVAFVTRIDASVARLMASRERPVVICSHGDWIPLCIARHCDASVRLKKGGVAELRERDDRLELYSLLQSLKLF